MNIKYDKKILADIADKFNLNYIVLFGSRADNTSHEKSDYDFGFSSRQDLNYTDEATIGETLAKAFKISSEIIETVNLNNAGPLLMKEVADKGVVLYERQSGAFANFQIYAFMSYMEAKPLFALKRAMLNDKIKTLK